VLLIVAAGLHAPRAEAALSANPAAILTSGNIGTTIGDVNGDGYSDVAVADPLNDEAGIDHGKVWIYLGGPNGLSTTPFWSTTGSGGGADPNYWRFGTELLGGDFNGDSFGDLCVVSGGYLNGSGVDWYVIYNGGSNGMSGGAAWYPPIWLAQELSSVVNAGDLDADHRDDIVACSSLNELLYINRGDGPTSSFHTACSKVAPAGDVNGDGFDDVFVVPATGGLTIWIGDGDDLAYGPSWTSSDCRAFGMVGDVNGDGFGDFFIARSIDNWIVTGRADMNDLAWQYSIPNGGWTSPVSFTAGDLDGNGLADLVIGDPNYFAGGTYRGRVWVYQSYFHGIDLVADFTGLAGEQLGGAGIGSAGDGNGDGFGDLLVPTGTAVKIFHGSSVLLYNQNAQFQYDGPGTVQAGASVAPAGDVNGDGYSDLLVGSSADYGGYGGRIACFLGGRGNTGTTPDWEILGPMPGASFGQSVASAGDVNGDGYTDVIVGAPGYGSGQVHEGAAYVYHGSATGLSFNHAWTYEPNLADAQFGWSVASAGDINGDGFADVVIGEPGYSSGPNMPDVGRANVFLGSRNGLSSTPSWTVTAGYDLARLGESVATAGDVNGDGFGDVIVGGPTDWLSTPWAGRVHIFYGSANGLPPGASWGNEGAQVSEHYGSSVATAGDVNGDGYSDILIGSPDFDLGTDADVGAVWLYLGGPAGPSQTPDRFLYGDQAGARFGASVAGAGDLNGDAFSDVIIGAPGRPYGGANVYMGGEDAFPVFVWGGWSSTDPNSWWGASVATAGDLNGDGFDEIVIGAPNYGSGRGRVQVYFGNYETSSFWWSEPVLPRQQRTNGRPLDFMGMSECFDRFTIAANARSPRGRSSVRLEYNASPLGTPFGSYHGWGTWFDTGAPTAQGSVIPLVSSTMDFEGDLSARWRVRVASRSIYFPHTPWFTMASQVPSLAVVRLDGNPAGISGATVFPGAQSIVTLSANPVETVVRLRFDITQPEAVVLSIYDVSGRRVRTLADGPFPAGGHETTWDTKDSRDRPVESGVYYACLSGNGWNRTTKVTVLR
jgi:hypothetical protein